MVHSDPRDCDNDRAKRPPLIRAILRGIQRVLQVVAGRSEFERVQDTNATRRKMSRAIGAEGPPAREGEANVIRFKSKIRTLFEPREAAQPSFGHEVGGWEGAILSAQRGAADQDERLAMVVHDLKAPLQAIKLSAASLLRQVANDRAEEPFRASVFQHLNLVCRNVDRMDAMVNALLDAAPRPSNGPRLDLARCNMAELVEQALELHRAVAENKGVKLAFRQRHPDCTIECDRDRMLRVLSNLIDNAVKFTPKGGTIEIESTIGEGDLVVCLRDTGPGILPAHLPFVFEKYWQDRSEGSHQGLGLGLAIVKEIVQAHEGRLWVASRPGVGSRFFFSIPRARTMRHGAETAAKRGLRLLRDSPAADSSMEC